MAMHKNRFWKSSLGYTLDVGAFVSALEYASGKSATIIGKPSLNLFVLAVEGWNLQVGEILMVGDDIRGDIVGASSVGMKSVLVKTGKFLDKNLRCSDVMPNYIINSIADLPDIIDLC